MNDVRICYGAGGHARVVLDVAKAQGVNFTRLVADGAPGNPVAGLNVEEASSIDLRKLGPFSFFVAIGRNDVRRRIFLDLAALGTPLTLIHPFTCIGSDVSIGRGVVLMPGVVVNTAARIEDNVILNTSCSVDHDCIIGAHSHLCPGVHLAGNVTVGAGTMIGTGASVIPGIQIGENCMIGAGAVVVRDIPSGSVAYGSPARVQKGAQV